MSAKKSARKRDLRLSSETRQVPKNVGELFFFTFQDCLQQSEKQLFCLMRETY